MTRSSKSSSPTIIPAWVRRAETRAWRWHRGGGLVIGLAFLWYMASGTLVEVRRLAARMRPAPVAPPSGSHCCR